MSSYKLAIGLGNCDGSDRYEGTRHNIGAEFISKIAREYGDGLSYDKYSHAYMSCGNILGKGIVFVNLKGYMNESGVNLKRVISKHKVSIRECIIFYDEIALSVGKVKVSFGGSAGGHNGVFDIIERCGNEFVRVRIGIGAKGHKGMDLADHVLGKIVGGDSIGYNNSYEVSKGILESLVGRGLEKTQSEYNRVIKEGKKDLENREDEKQ